MIYCTVLQAYRCLSPYGVCLSRQRVITKLQAAGTSHDEAIVQRKEAIQTLYTKEKTIDEELQMQLAKLSDVPDIGIKFIDESSIPHVHVALASKQHARQKAICKKSSDAGSMANSGTEHDKAAMTAIDAEFSLFQKIEANEMCKLDTLIEQKMHIQRSMQEMLYQVIGDNLDLYIKVKHMTSENQNK